MNRQTEKLLEATLKSDETITPAERNRILKLIARNGESAPVQNGNGHSTPRLYSRAEAAAMLGNKSPRFIDLLARRGLLKRFIPRGNLRGIGITSESLHSFIAGN
jgi:hypothetical protein